MTDVQIDGALFSQAYSTAYVSQIFQDYRTGQVALRGKNNGVWTGWRTVWDSVNLTNLNQLTNGPGYITATANTASATKLATARSINGVAFDGTADITIATGAAGNIVSVISTNTTAVSNTIYVMIGSLTLTLPASPTSGDIVYFSNRSNTSTAIVARNGQLIMGLAENMTIDIAQGMGSLVFADATRGWVLL